MPLIKNRRARIRKRNDGSIFETRRLTIQLTAIDELMRSNKHVSSDLIRLKK